MNKQRWIMRKIPITGPAATDRRVNRENNMVNGRFVALASLAGGEFVPRDGSKTVGTLTLAQLRKNCRYSSCHFSMCARRSLRLREE
jgi:hypothetical protein